MGVTIPNVRLVNNSLFAAERFDRTANGGKIHTVSMAGLMSADFRQPIYDYDTLFEITGALTHSQTELDELFRRMAYNVISGNTDDHLKNFSMQYKDGRWQHSPMYDIAPAMSKTTGHFTSVNNNSYPENSDMLALAERHNVQNAREILQNIRKICSKRFERDTEVER